MAQGLTTDKETIYKIMLSYYVTRNYRQTGRDLGINDCTIRKIVKENKDKEEFMELYAQKKEEFLSIYKEYITRAGSDKLLQYMLSPDNDFFTAPASTRSSSPIGWMARFACVSSRPSR